MPLLSELVEVAEATDTLPVLDMTSVTGAGGDDMCEVEVEVLEESAILQVGDGDRGVGEVSIPSHSEVVRV